MLKNERLHEIVNILSTQNGFATVAQLCATLYASESSIRRDLSALESRGLIKRSYGGAELIYSASNVVAFHQRAHENTEAKKAIAKKAATLVKDGNIVFIDQSSSAYYLAELLRSKNNLTDVTNAIQVINLLADTDIKVISSGGQLSRENRTCLIGADACLAFENTYADIVFFSTKSLAEDGTISDCTREEIFVRKPMLKNAAKKAFLCDSSKFCTRSAYVQCTLKDVDYLICENEKAQAFSACAKNLIIL